MAHATKPDALHTRHSEAPVHLRRTLIGIDFSAPSFEAARWGARYLAGGAEIVLAHVIAVPQTPPIMAGRFPRRDLMIDTLREGAGKRLGDLRSSLASDGTSIEIREGVPAECLATLAEELSVDLIIIGAHGERVAVGDGLGTTAEALVRATHVPLLLATKVSSGPPGRILVAMDDSASEAGALRWAAALSTKLGAQVTGFQVIPATAASSVLSNVGVGALPSVGFDTRTAGAELQPDEPLVARLMTAGVSPDSAQSEVAFGDVVQEILAAAGRMETDLIIVGRRQKGDFRRSIFGSVVDGLLRGANCPVLVVPEPRKHS